MYPPKYLIFLIAITIIIMTAPSIIFSVLIYKGIIPWSWYQMLSYTFSSAAVGGFSVFIIQYMTEHFHVYPDRLNEYKDKLKLFNDRLERIEKGFIETNKSLSKKTNKR